MDEKNNLPKVDFNIDNLKLDILFENENYLKETKKDALINETPSKIKEIYGDLFMPESDGDLPHVYSSFVYSFDGKIGFPDLPEGPLVSSKNELDPAGGKADFWLLNVLRTYADVIIRGAKTLEAEEEGTGHIFDDDLIDIRKNKLQKEKDHPINLIVSLDGTDIPLNHKVFNVPEVTVWINTSPKGVEYLRQNWEKEFIVLDDFENKQWKEIIKEAKKDDILVICTGRDSKTDSLQLLKILKEVEMEQISVESPSYTWHLMKNSLVDEMFINYSGLYIGGEMTFGLNDPFTSEDHPHAKIVKLAMHNSTFLYTRQKMIY
ncbi:MAG: dihydrofolate reductase family protein [Halanaerobiales bacterium]|nr:dihydrofolate reductase family protein [Halanaerobiales bacterium]